MSEKFYLQSVVKDLLTTALGSIAPVIDQCAQDQPHPYVTLSTMSAGSLDDSCTRRWEITLTILVASLYKGFKEVADIQKIIDEALAYYSEVGSEYYIIGIVPISSDLDRDDVKRIGTQTFNCIVGKH